MLGALIIVFREVIEAGLIVGIVMAVTQGVHGSRLVIAAGVVAGVSSVYAVGAIYATLPAGSITTNVQGQTYYLSGNTWFYPSYGANGVYYRVVPAP